MSEPSEDFLEIFCESGGAVSATCGCGQFWFGQANDDAVLVELRSYPANKELQDDSVSVNHFRGILWVSGCNCKVKQWLADTEKWIRDNAQLFGNYFTRMNDEADFRKRMLTGAIQASRKVGRGA